MSVKLREEVEPKLEVARDPRLEVNDPRLLPEEHDSVLADRLEFCRRWKETAGGTEGEQGSYSESSSGSRFRLQSLYIICSEEKFL